MKILCIFSLILITIPLLNPANPTSRRVLYRHENDAQKNLPEVGEIVSAREKLRGYVLDVKEKFKPSDNEYLEARKLYRDAQSEYTAWISELKLAIIKGAVKDLRKDKEYKARSEKAGKAGKAFADYAQDVTIQSKSLIPFLSAIADIGIKIWNNVKDRKDKERKMFADAFADEVKWERWEDITLTPQKSTKPDLQ